ncbi:MAG: hypothetical protein EOO53_11380 [Gammaproteobacteria bacterium]|nr:MAG: hypothetical protein EOO53_11380 [Gammaproteobacteria bacterium]
MKQISVISALILSATLMGCGGASTSDDKPASLLPDGFVLSSASSSSVPAGNGSSSSIANGAKTTLPVYENFEAVDIDGFLSANYKHLSTDTTLPLYYVTSGYPVSTNPDGVPRILLTNWTSKALWLSNSRFTLGQTRLEAGTTTADPTVAAWGELDLSKAYKLSFCVKDTKPSTSKRMMIFVDNNTTVQANSIHGNSNRIMYELTSVLVPGQRYTVTSAVGSSSSFLQIRVESGTDVVIDDLVLEYQDAPYTGSVPACVADTSFVRPVATASSASSAASSVVSSVASSASSSSVSSAASSDVGAVSSTASSAVSSSLASSASSSSTVSSASSSTGTVSALLTEDFTPTDAAAFFTNAYKANPVDNNLPLYVAASGGTRITFANGQLSMNNARFTIGDKTPTTATAAGVAPNGGYDLSKNYRIKFTVTAFTGAGNFQVYVDNNTTSAGSSFHSTVGSTASRLLQVVAGDLGTLPHEVIIESAVGTATSFLQFRADSNVTNITIDNLTIEYQ